MISDFFCECHGPLHWFAEDETKVYAREIIAPGKNFDGYWTNEDVVRQLEEKAIKAFDVLHPGQKAVFAFDNSSNHHTVRGDGLCAN